MVCKLAPKRWEELADTGPRRWAEKYDITKVDLEALQRVFKQLDSTNRGKIGPDDLARVFQRLEYEPPAVTDFGNR